MTKRIRRKYPIAADRLEQRALRYMDDINYARRCELTGKLLIVAPDDTCGVSTLCREPEALLRLYDKGRQDGRRILDFL